MADRHLVNSGCTMADTLVFIIDCIHYLLVSKICESVLADRSICGKQSRPCPLCLETAKVQIVAQIIKVATFGFDVSVESLFAAFCCIYDSDSKNFSLYTIKFMCNRISSEEYGFQPSAFNLCTANWDNFKKAIFHRCLQGVWSYDYV
jgi:hypothetical protein